MSMLEEIVRLFNVLNPSEPLSRHFYGYLRVLSQVSRSFREQSMLLDMTWVLPGNVNRHRHRFPINDFTSQAVRALFGLSGPAESETMANLRLARDPPGGPAQRNGFAGITAFLNRVQHAVYYRFSAWNFMMGGAPPLFISSTGLPYDWDAPRGAREAGRRRGQYPHGRIPDRGRWVPNVDSGCPMMNAPSGPTEGGWPVNLNEDGRSAEHENFLARFDARMRASKERTRQGKKRKQGEPDGPTFRNNIFFYPKDHPSYIKFDR
jgi:hypothetical protein